MEIGQIPSTHLYLVGSVANYKKNLKKPQTPNRANLYIDENNAGIIVQISKEAKNVSDNSPEYRPKPYVPKGNKNFAEIFDDKLEELNGRR